MVVGITGDLAKVMTFRSLYRLEKRGLLDCPIDQLRERASRHFRQRSPSSENRRHSECWE